MEKLIEAINKASNPVKFGGLAAALAVITAGNFFLFIQDVEDGIAAAIAQQTTLEATLVEKQAIAQNLNERRKELDKAEQDLNEALIELPEKKDIDELLAQLNDVGKKSGLSIASVEPGGETPAGFYSRLPIKVAVSGNYHEIALFLQEISNLRRIVNVSEIKLAGSTEQKTTDKVILGATFLATTFRFQDQGNRGGGNK